MKAMWIAFGFSVVIAFVADYGLTFAGYSTQEKSTSSSVRLDE